MKDGKLLSLRMVAYLGVLAAMGIVLAALRPVNLWDVRVSFTFVPIAAGAILFGALPAAILGAVIDVLGAILFPSGSFFPGFTLTAFLHGLIYGLLLYQEPGKTAPAAADVPEPQGFFRRHAELLRVVLAVLLYLVVCSLGLNTLWISILYGSPFLPSLLRRLVQAAVMGPVQIVIIGLMLPILNRLRPSLRLP